MLIVDSLHSPPFGGRSAEFRYASGMEDEALTRRDVLGRLAVAGRRGGAVSGRAATLA
ncbi:hypothetical protein ACFO1B_41660 [Dactylosporangium siamense]|uniref:Uncharacterized protein n=1 Tax=Dactylosporangium siamense TaxID=685454 RepID=A0A919PHF6_9ACTN|nr:hypothetical protein [Dactylosporangium siamense]GIG44925.1 hypothetical protein Dsi01nite_029660 [Dactylosporangium siamense]